MRFLYCTLVSFFLASSASAILITVAGTDYNIEWEIGVFSEIDAAHSL